MQDRGFLKLSFYSLEKNTYIYMLTFGLSDDNIEKNRAKTTVKNISQKLLKKL